MIDSRRAVASLVAAIISTAGTGIRCAAANNAETENAFGPELNYGIATRVADAIIRRPRVPVEAPLSISREAGEGRPTFDVLPNLLDNRVEFKGEFYDRLTLRPSTLHFDDGRNKTYYFPTLYGDVTTAVAVFLCSKEKAEELLQSAGLSAAGLEPVNMGLLHSAVIVTSYRYNKVYGIPPYNEIAISIPVIASGKSNLPIVSLLKPDGYYVASMPVTTFENQQRGLKFWGLPKVVQRIDLYTEGEAYVTVAYDESGAEYLRFQVPMSGGATASEQANTIYSVLNGKVLTSPTRSEGTFHAKRFPAVTRLVSGEPSTRLILGSSRAADLLRDLDVFPYPFEVRFGQSISSTFDLPNQ